MINRDKKDKKNKPLLTELLSKKSSVKNFLDNISPSVIKFFPEYFIMGNSYRSVWSIRDYQISTEEQALLRVLGEKENITVKIYVRHLTHSEENKIIKNATNKNMMNRNMGNLRSTVEAEENLRNVSEMITYMHRNKESLLFCSVFIEMIGNNLENLKKLESNVSAELTKIRINADRLFLNQKEGFLSVNLVGKNSFKGQFERVLPAKSVANLYPLSYSGKTDIKGFSIGKDVNGTYIIIDTGIRTKDKTNSNIIIMGNSGEGKSHLEKLILTNRRMAGKKIVSLDCDNEYGELTENLGGCNIDLMTGENIINVLEPKIFDDDKIDENSEDEIDKKMQGKTYLRQHISFLKDFFKSYKPDLESKHTDVLEIILTKMYNKFKIDDTTDTSCLEKKDYPILSDLYQVMEDERKNYNEDVEIYREDTLQELILSLHSICIGNDSKFFNGHTNISTNEFVNFVAKGVMNTNTELKNALLFNTFSYMSHELLTMGNTVCAIDEFHLFLSNKMAVRYVNNFEKRVRKKQSEVIIASQNIEEFLMKDVKELTKPLFSIPTYQFYFNPGSVDLEEFRKHVQLEKSEVNLIKNPRQGVCLFRCGIERFHLEVIAEDYKKELFGKGGGT